MTRFILLTLTIISLPYIADALVDRQFGKPPTVIHEPTGYSRSDVSGVNRIIERETRPAKHKKTWLASELDADVAALFGGEGVK
jgi:hypothetical protein